MRICWYKEVAKLNILPSRIKRGYYYLLLEWFKTKLLWQRRLQTLSIRIGYFAGSIIGITLAIFLLLPFAQDAISKYSEIHNVFLAIGGTIGTMLALVLSLAIIPVQRAAEVFTPTVIRLYRNDRVTLWIFILLVFLCVASFVLGIKNLFPGVPKIAPLGILAVACSLDLIRWHQRHITELLDPSFAISQLSGETTKFIEAFQGRVSKLAHIQFKSLSEEERKGTAPEAFETALYSVNNYHSDWICNWAEELSEITLKAVARDEIYTAEAGIHALVGIAQRYLDARKGNILFFPSPDALLLAKDNDANRVINRIYETLQEINKSAIARDNETVSIHVVRAFETMAIFTAKLKIQQSRENEAPLTFAPIFYLRECVRATQRKGMVEPAFQSSKCLLRIGVSAPKHVDISNVFTPLIGAWVEIVRYLYIIRKGALSNHVLSDMLQLMNYLFEQEHFQVDYIFKEMLTKIEEIVAIALANERIAGKEIIGLSLSPYDLGNPSSLGYLIGNLATKIKSEEDKPWADPYHHFKEINQNLHRHFRNIAENIDFGDSFLFWHFAETIKHVLKVYLYIMENPLRDAPDHSKNLSGQVPWYLAFFWVSFSGSKMFHFNHAEKACDIMAWAGLAFYSKGYPNVTQKCVSNISSIINTYPKFSRSHEEYNMADLFMSLWKIRMYAHFKKNDNFVKEINKHLDVKPKMLSDEQWGAVLSAIFIRKEQLNERLHESDMLLFREDSTSLLKELLEEN